MALFLKNNQQNILFNSLSNDEYHLFLKKLFDYSSLINKTNDIGETILHHVCFYGMIDKYYALINMGANIEKTNESNNLLHYASFSGKDNFLIVELIKANILPTEKNIKGQTSLHIAKNKQIAHYLHLWCNRNNVSVLDLKDNNGNYLTHTAQYLGNLEVVDYWSNQYPLFNTLTNNMNERWMDITPITLTNMNSQYNIKATKNNLLSQ